MIQNQQVITFANGKGGVGKTSCATNVAGLAAATGWKVLLVDLDPQFSNAGHDLGYAWPQEDGEAGTDNGEHLVQALTRGVPLQPVLRDVRPNLDVICGGEHLNDLEDILAGRSRRNQETSRLLAEALQPLVTNYDLVIIDTPPTRPTLIQLALVATRWLVVPTKSDRASIEGLRALAAEMERVRPLNGVLAVLGVVLFDVGTSSTVIRSNAAEDVAAILGGSGEIFTSTIRHSEATAQRAREDGKLVHELASLVDGAEPYWEAVKQGRRPERLPTGAPTLMGDYVALTQELIGRALAHQDQPTEGVAR